MSKYIPASIRQQVRIRAGDQCEYCLVPELITLQSHEIDHVIARKHGGQSEIENLALSRSLCNKFKGSDIASIDPDNSEIIPLYNPRNFSWKDHFRLTSSAEIVPLTAIGQATVMLLHFNAPERLAERAILLEAGVLTIPK